MDDVASDLRSGTTRMKAGGMVDVLARDRTGEHIIKQMKWGLVSPHFQGSPC